MANVDALLGDYAAHHTTKGNVICHFVGIPLIIYGILAMLLTVPLLAVPGLGVATLAEALILIVTVYYLTLDLRLAVGMLVAISALDALARAMGDWRVGLAAFVVGWVFQGIGHAVYEKRSPAFLRNFVHLLVGPIFLVNEVIHARRIEAAHEA